MSKDLNYHFIENLKNLPFVDEIWLFGSRARLDHGERSDIDLAIICPNATEEDWINIMNIVEDADSLLKIDCVKFDRSKISEELFNNIEKDKRVIYVKK